MAVRGADCFRTTFRPNATTHDIVNAYLLMMTNRLVFPDEIGAVLTDRADFERKFKSRFTPLGIDKFEFVHDAPERQFDTNGVIMSNDRVVIVAFRGTEFRAGVAKLIKDFINTDLDFEPMPQFGNGAKVHTGFWHAFEEVRGSVIEAVREQRSAGQRVWVTGHSLGGAQATLAARTLRQDGLEVQGLYTYGSPRVGNEEFRSRLGIGNVQRYVYALDIVPMVPDDLVIGYRHVGRTNNFHVPPFPGASPYDSVLKPNDRETRAPIGNAADHLLERYEAALFHHLSAEQQDAVPAPALRE